MSYRVISSSMIGFLEILLGRIHSIVFVKITAFIITCLYLGFLGGTFILRIILVLFFYW